MTVAWRLREVFRVATRMLEAWDREEESADRLPVEPVMGERAVDRRLRWVSPTAWEVSLTCLVGVVVEVVTTPTPVEVVAAPQNRGFGQVNRGQLSFLTRRQDRTAQVEVRVEPFT